MTAADLTGKQAVNFRHESVGFIDERDACMESLFEQDAEALGEGGGLVQVHLSAPHFLGRVGQDDAFEHAFGEVEPGEGGTEEARVDEARIVQCSLLELHAAQVGLGEIAAAEREHLQMRPVKAAVSACALLE